MPCLYSNLDFVFIRGRRVRFLLAWGSRAGYLERMKVRDLGLCPLESASEGLTCAAGVPPEVVEFAARTHLERHSALVPMYF